MLLPNNAFVVYVEPRKRVWWLQMSFFSARGADSASPNQSAVVEGHFEEGEREGRMK